jgi:hypothetical protein
MIVTEAASLAEKRQDSALLVVQAVPKPATDQRKTSVRNLIEPLPISVLLFNRAVTNCKEV